MYNTEDSLGFGLISCDPATIQNHDLPKHSYELFDRPEFIGFVDDFAGQPLPGDELTFKITREGWVKKIITLYIYPPKKFQRFSKAYLLTCKIVHTLGNTQYASPINSCL